MTCDAGYHVFNNSSSHNESAVCTLNGTWSPSTYSQCIPIDCGQWSSNSSVRSHQKIIYTNATVFGSEVVMKCNQGYHVFNTNKSRTESAVCQENGTWSSKTYSECVPTDCGEWSTNSSALANHNIIYPNSTSYGSQAVMTCDPGYHIVNKAGTRSESAVCTENGIWSTQTFSDCIPIDCGRLPNPSNGYVFAKASTYESTATIKCHIGYTLQGGSTSSCGRNGEWSSTGQTCSLIECPVLDPYDKLTIELDPNTTKPIVNTTAMFSCPPNSSLVGYKTIKCTINGRWTGPVPKCIMLDKTVRNCSVDDDTKNRTWRETQPGAIVLENCPNGYSGEISRQCSEEGRWLNPFYNCVSERVAQLIYEVKSIEEAPSSQKITHSLDQLVNLTKPNNGTSYIGELNAITNMLDIIASVSGNIEITDEQANSFFAATSNLLDYDNAESWKSGDDHNEINGSPDRSSTANPSAMKVLNVVDKYADILMNTLANNSESSKTIQMDNMVVHVSKVNTTIDDLKFPDKPVNISSSVILPKASLIGSNSIAAVVYRNLTGIVSSKLKNDSDYTINSEVVTVTLDNWENTTNFFLDITMDYAQNLHSAPICSFWNTTLFAWDTTGCLVMSSNHSSATCRCTHLTNFAILMSPFIQSRASTKHLDIISIVGCSVSLAGLVLTITFHIALWKYVSKRRVAVLLNLSVALIIAYVMFIGGIDRTESKIICTTLASLLHYIYLVVFSLMLVEGIDVAVSILIVFQTQSKLKWMLSAAWVVPAVIVGITLGVTKTEGYGNESSCWLTIKGGVIWAFVGPALLVVLVNFIILVFVIRATLRSYTMAKKSTVERSKSAVWCLLVLLPLMGLTWVLGVFYLDESMAWVQYAFAVCNSLQLWKAYKTKKQRSSYASRTFLKSRSTSVRSVITENSEVSMNVNDTFEIPSVDESAITRYKDLPIKQPMQTAAQADKEEQVDGFSKHSGDNTTDDKLRRNGDEETVNKNSNDVGLENPADKFLFSTAL
ncbi:adhesion G protein-coupled receptor B3-like isoform X2 [Dreissena polymorpha]|uniref:adhesion G protein-coupled receptor B3-like isoform X2 n=1 Tax=Dreissena polymorpha TaxID=45954 RepID=UPI0022656E2A|nr:adhesion G protein-coupled receptor B3-like isoform X2 [Dreissena polymorpha]